MMELNIRKEHIEDAIEEGTRLPHRKTHGVLIIRRRWGLEHG